MSQNCRERDDRCVHQHDDGMWFKDWRAGDLLLHQRHAAQPSVTRLQLNDNSERHKCERNDYDSELLPRFVTRQAGFVHSNNNDNRSANYNDNREAAFAWRQNSHLLRQTCWQWAHFRHHNISSNHNNSIADWRWRPATPVEWKSDSVGSRSFNDSSGNDNSNGNNYNHNRGSIHFRKDKCETVGKRLLHRWNKTRRRWQTRCVQNDVGKIWSFAAFRCQDSNHNGSSKKRYWKRQGFK